MGYSLYLFAMDKDTVKDVSTTVLSSTSTLLTSAARRPCPRCTHRMISLTYVNRSLYFAYRAISYSVDVRCSERRFWVARF